MASMACKRVVGQILGPKPSIMRWIYVIVMRPMVSDVSFLRWWKSVKQSLLPMIPRLNCLLNTLNTKHYEERANYCLEAILDLPSLPDTIRKEAGQSAVRILDEL
jgi:hypothetical protein